jgi:hypothetical protein
MARKAVKKSSLASTLARSALRRGTIGGQRGFLAVPAGLAVLRAVRRATTKTPEVIAIEKLQPGERLELVTIRPPTRKERKAARR